MNKGHLCDLFQFIITACTTILFVRLWPLKHATAKKIISKDSKLLSF